MVAKSHLLALDAATTVGIVLCLTKVADLVLRPHQEKLLREKLESLTLWLNYSNPLRYYRRVIDRTLLNVVAIALLAAIFPYYRALVTHLWTLREERHALASLGAIGIFLWSVRNLRKHGGWMISATAGEYKKSNRLEFGLRQFLFATIKIEAFLLVISPVTGSLFYFVSAGLIDHTINYNQELMGYAVLAISPFLYESAEFGGCAAIVLLA